MAIRSLVQKYVKHRQEQPDLYDGHVLISEADELVKALLVATRELNGSVAGCDARHVFHEHKRSSCCPVIGCTQWIGQRNKQYTNDTRAHFDQHAQGMTEHTRLTTPTGLLILPLRTWARASRVTPSIPSRLFPTNAVPLDLPGRYLLAPGSLQQNGLDMMACLDCNRSFTRDGFDYHRTQSADCQLCDHETPCGRCRSPTTLCHYDDGSSTAHDDTSQTSQRAAERRVQKTVVSAETAAKTERAVQNTTNQYETGQPGDGSLSKNTKDDRSSTAAISDDRITRRDWESMNKTAFPKKKDWPQDMQLSGLVTVMPVHNGRNRNKRNKFKARQAVLEPLVEKELYWAMPIAPVDRCAGPADYTWDRKTLHQVLGDGHLTLPGSGEFGRYSQEVEDCLIYGLPTTCPVVNRVLVAMRSSSEAFVGEVRLAQRLENEIIGHRLITRHGDRFDQRIITCEWFNQKGTSAFARTVGPRHDQGTWELNERMMEAIIEHGPDIPVHNPHVDRDKGRPFSAE